MPLIYAIEDDENIRQLLKTALEAFGYQVEAFETAAEGLTALGGETPDLLLLDIMLPDADGVAVLRQLRGDAAFEKLPIMMLTAKSSEIDKVTGLDAGADDYMTKPFAPEELLARLRALTRRQGQGEPPAPQGLAFADLRLDPSARSLHREGKSVQLSPKEFELLRLLMGRAGAVCPKGEILDRLWGGAEDNNLEAYISFLRKKFFYLGSRASIATLRKVGYRLDDPDRPV